MGANSKIQWTDHTFNPWIGCLKINEGCKYCYAEILDKRWGNDRWGPGEKRTRTSEANRKKPLQWDKEAFLRGIRYKVFCASLADIFEDNDQVIDWRLDLFDMVKSTPNLDWLILTKRPHIARRFFGLRKDFILENVWLGVSISDQETANELIPDLIKIPTRIRFISYEPALGEVNFNRIPCPNGCEPPNYCNWCYPDGFEATGTIDVLNGGYIDWVIIGGESGPKARPFHLEWADNIIRQCKMAGVACFVKQLGNKPFIAGEPYRSTGKGDNPDEWRKCLKVREFPDR